MTAAHRLSDLTPTHLVAQRGGLAPTQSAKMNFYDLQNHFWQLNAVERFTGNQTSLYFYWLNLFNAGLNGEYWPAEYPRFGTQVQADLGLTDKTLAAARKVLESRGLLYHREGSKSKAAVWSLHPITRKNSGQSPTIGRNNSDQSEEIASHLTRNNSDQSGEFDGIASHMTRKNSGLYKEKTETCSRTEDTNKKKAGASEAFPSPSPSQKITAPTPVAAAPSPAAVPRLGSVEPCLVPGTDESRTLAAEMASYWRIPSHNQRRIGQFATFTRTMAAAGRLEEVRTQFEAYRRYQQLRGISRFGIEKYLGHELEGYADGEWCGSEWPDLLAEASQQQGAKKPFGPEPTPAQSGSGPKSKQTTW